MSVPMPGEVHPAYAEAGYVLDFVEGRGGWPRDHLFIAYERGIRFDALDPFPDRTALVKRVMTRSRCAGPAPYTGARPFHYEWWVGTDELGRAVAGEARIVHHNVFD